jgi:hypothetical protein
MVGVRSLVYVINKSFIIGVPDEDVLPHLYCKKCGKCEILQLLSYKTSLNLSFFFQMLMFSPRKVAKLSGAAAAAVDGTILNVFLIQ